MIRNVELADSAALEFNSRKDRTMKKTTAKKVSKKTSPKASKKNRSYVSDMMRRDMESCIERNKELALAGILMPKKDIFKDDPCYGCKFALENKEVSGPFDRRFKCNGFPRIENELAKAIEVVRKCGIGNQKFISSMSYCPMTESGHLTEDDVRNRLLHAQNVILHAASLIGERVANGKLECIETSGKPSCFVGTELDEYLAAK